MLDCGSEPFFPLPLANIFGKTLMSSAIKMQVPFYLQYQMFGVNTASEENFWSSLLGSSILHLVSSLQLQYGEICRRNEPPVSFAL